MAHTSARGQHSALGMKSWVHSMEPQWIENLDHLKTKFTFVYKTRTPRLPLSGIAVPIAGMRNFRRLPHPRQPRLYVAALPVPGSHLSNWALELLGFFDQLDVSPELHMRSFNAGFLIAGFGRVWQLNCRLIEHLFKVGVRFTGLGRVCVGGLFDYINSVGVSIIDEASHRLLITCAVGFSIR